MESSLYNAVNYIAPIQYITNTYITEYDLSKANISCLLYYGVIDNNQYNYLYNLPKQGREVEIGLMIKNNKEVYNYIKKGIIEAKKLLIETNNIDDSSILSIKNDAVFVIGDNNSIVTDFGILKFSKKNVYSIFMRLQNIEIYYGDSIDYTTGEVTMKFDVKGINDSLLPLHQNGMLGLICEICYRLQRENIKDTIEYFQQIYEQFINRKLPKEYYRNFDSYSKYRINTFTRYIEIDNIEENMIQNIDINRNLSIMRDLYSIISNIYRLKY